MVVETQCKSLAPTPTGGRSSDMRIHSSQTGITTRYLMFQEEKILKDKPFGSGRNTEEPTRDGQFSMLTRHQRQRLKDSTKNSASISTDHSTSDQDFQ
jgi:hypothetical protein